MNEDMFAGTPYAHDPLGTKASFDKTTGAMLKEFYDKWYAPSNVDPGRRGRRGSRGHAGQDQEALCAMFPAIPSPARPAVNLQPIKSETFTLDSNLPYVSGLHRLSVAWHRLARLRGHADSWPTCWPASAPTSTAWFPRARRWPRNSASPETYRQGQRRLMAWWRCRPAQTPLRAIEEMRQIVTNYAKTGVPEDLVDAAKRSEIAQAEFQRNSIPGLADVWSNALAAEGRNSPEEDIDAIRKVTLADVNRVAKQYLLNAPTITATLKPVPNGAPVSAKGFGGAEAVTSAPTKPVELPAWAAARLNQLQVPHDFIQVSDTMLPNGIRLIVRTDHTSPTVTVVGAVKHNSDLQTPPGRRRPRRRARRPLLLRHQTLDRLAFQKALDDIAANESAGYGFSLQRPEGLLLARRSIARRQRTASSACPRRPSRSRRGKPRSLSPAISESPAIAPRARSTWRCCPPAILCCAKPRPRPSPTSPSMT